MFQNFPHNLEFLSNDLNDKRKRPHLLDFEQHILLYNQHQVDLVVKD